MSTLAADLFGPTEVVPHPEKLVYPDLYSLYAREIFGVPDDWAWYELTALPEHVPDGFFRMDGAVAPMKPKARRRDWRKMDKETVRRFFIARADFDAWKAARERTTGVCQECAGHGKTLASASAAGVTYRTCRHCDGSGAAPSPSPQEGEQ